MGARDENGPVLVGIAQIGSQHTLLSAEPAAEAAVAAILAAQRVARQHAPVIAERRAAVDDALILPVGDALVGVDVEPPANGVQAGLPFGSSGAGDAEFLLPLAEYVVG